MILRSMFSMTGLNALKGVASVLVSMLVARAVAPAEFGLIAFSIPLMSFITVLTDLGLTSALVRHSELTDEEAGAAVCLMTITGLVGSALLAATARPIGSMLSLHGLARVLTGFALVTLFSICAAGPRALLERRLAYTRIATIEAGALAVGLGTFAVGLAFSLGVMALVAYYVTVQLVRSVSFMFSSRSFFVVNFRFSGIIDLCQIGGWVLLTNLLSYFARNLDNLLIGSFLGAASLGLYGLAYQFMTLPLVLVSWPASGVLLATLARLHGDLTSRKVDVISAVFTGTTAVSFPLMTFLAFGMRFPIDNLFTNRWHGLSYVIAVLAPIGAIQSIAVYNGAVLIEKGSVKLNFLLSLLNSLILTCIFVISVWFGLFVLVWSYAVAAIILSTVLIYFTCREAGIGLNRFFSCLIPGSLASIAGLASAAAVTGISPQSFDKWMICSLAYTGAVLGMLALSRRRLFMTARTLIMAGAEIADTGKQ